VDRFESERRVNALRNFMLFAAARAWARDRKPPMKEEKGKKERGRKRGPWPINVIFPFPSQYNLSDIKRGSMAETLSVV
jgi:hypothetical protein